MDKLNFEHNRDEFLLKTTGKQEFQILNDFIEKNKNVKNFKTVCNLLKQDENEKYKDYFRALEIAENWNVCEMCPMTETQIQNCPAKTKYLQIKIDDEGNDYHQICKVGVMASEKEKEKQKQNKNF